MDEDDDLDAVLASVPMPTDDSGIESYGSGSASLSSGGQLEESAGSAGAVKKSASKGLSILVNPRQRGNPLLKHIRNVPWEYDSEIIPDYVIGSSICALFLSVRYYNLHPDYIHERLKGLKHSYTLRILLVLIDVSDPYPILKTLTHIGMLADLTIMPCNSAEDAGKILETYKIYENKPPDVIQEKQDSSAVQQVMDALTSIRSVNKTDAVTLLKVFGTLANLIEAGPERIALCPGIGIQKAQRIHAALHEPFKNV